MKPIHYLWVGPKPTDGKKGMDTMGVDLMRAKYPDQDIHFWCLNSEVDKYKKHFAARHGEGSIQVHGIESFVEENGDKAYLAFIKKLLERADRFENKVSKIQERITIKDSFSYYLQMYRHGAILDSSITPDESAPKDTPLFDDIKTFSASWTFEFEIGDRPDPWLMVAIKGDPKAKDRFEEYIRNVTKQFDRLGELEQNSLIRPLITTAFVHSAKIDIDERGQLFTKTHPPGQHKTTGIKKIYINTHRGDTPNSKTHPALSLLRAQAYLETEYYISENNLLPYESLPYSVVDKTKMSIKTDKTSLVGYLKEQRRRCRTNIEKTQDELDALPSKLAEEIEALKARKEQGEFDPKPYTEKPAPKDNSLASRKGVNFKITLPPTAAGISFHQTTPRILPQSKPMSSDEKLAYLIKDAKRQNESNQALKRKMLETYRERIEHYSAAIERFDSLFEEKIKHFDSDLFFETLNDVSSHLFSHLAIESPKPIHSTDKLIDYLSGSPQKGPLMALTKCLLASGPITPDNKAKYIASIKTYLKESRTQGEEPHLFKDQVKMPFQDDKTNQFLDTLIARLNTQSRPLP